MDCRLSLFIFASLLLLALQGGLADAKKETGYIGCFNENIADPILPYQEFTNKPKPMRPNRCRKLCARADFRFFGLRNGTECWCGSADYAFYGAANETECNIPCEAGNKKCGGEETMSVYRVTLCSAVCYNHTTQCVDSGANKENTTCLNCQGNTEGNHCEECLPGYSGDPTTGNCTAATDDDYIGCYQENPAAPALSVQKFSNQMNPIRPNRCRSLCEGFRFYGLRNGNECWCGNGNYALYGAARESQCNLPCAAGNKNCGGVDAMSVYRVTPCREVCNNHTTECFDSGANMEVTTCLSCQGNTAGDRCQNCAFGFFGNPLSGPCTAPDDEYIGCFADDLANPVLPLQRLSEKPLLPDGCRNLCEGFRFFGLRNGNECWCGSTDYALYGAAGEASCNIPCTNGGSKCGGASTLSVYRVTPCSDECNNHSTSCADSGPSKEFTTCLACDGNTAGDHCETCAAGFIGDAVAGDCSAQLLFT